MPINRQAILVVGGAGFIGSHMVLTLLAHGYLPVVLDNLSSGHAHAVSGAELIVGDMNNKTILRQLFKTYQFAAVLHFAAFIAVDESVQAPQKYYCNNVAATLQLLDVILASDIKYFVFSSSAAVYGEPLYTPIDECHPLQPLSPYGRSKRMIEEILQDFGKSYDFHYAILRYFNAAGNDPEGRIGERHDPETHLIPRILRVAAGVTESISIFGNDYATTDGTCVRDYVHVNDICSAHLLALEALFNGQENLTLNIGTGRGFSVQEVLDCARRITEKPITHQIKERRAQEPAMLIADPTRIKKALTWQAQHSQLEQMITDSWRYLQKTN